MRKLVVDDIAVLRAYERERAELRQRIIALKKTRRVEVGPFVTMVFENTDTMRWQVQEMARVERMLRDEQIAHEVETYNRLIPDRGELSATLMIELTSEPALRVWLPQLVDIEHHVAIVLADGTRIPGRASDEDESRLTRAETTSAVHFLRFAFTASEVDRFADGAVRVVIDHPAYEHEFLLDDVRHGALLGDLRAGD
ncbi:MAG: DUF3501 family protein [Actinomycetota bacterium]